MKSPASVHIEQIKVIDGQLYATVRAERWWLAWQFLVAAARWTRWHVWYWPMMAAAALRIWRGQ